MKLKKFLSLALALVLSLGVTAPIKAFAKESDEDNPYRDLVDASIICNTMSSPVPDEVTIAQGESIGFFFETVYDMVNLRLPESIRDEIVGEFHQSQVRAPKITFSNKDAITFDTDYKGDPGFVIGGDDTGSVRHIQIEATGDVGDSTEVYAEAYGHRLWICTITVGKKGTGVQGKGIRTKKPAPVPHKQGLYGIVETGTYDATELSQIGVYSPLNQTFDPSRSFEDQALALNGNISCALMNYHICQVSAGYDSIAFMHQRKSDGKYGLLVESWRHSKDEGIACYLNSVLKAFVFFCNSKNAGEALFAFLDKMCCSDSADPASFGFADSNPNGTKGTLTYKDGTKIEYDQSGGKIDFIFTPASAKFLG